MNKGSLWIVAALAALGETNFNFGNRTRISLRGKSDDQVREMIIEKCKKDECSSPSMAAGDLLAQCETHDDAERLTHIALEMPRVDIRKEAST